MNHIYLITGGGGFIGANVASALVRSGEDVHVILKKQTHPWRLESIRDKLHIHTVDLCDKLNLRRVITEIRPSVIYHTATYGAYECQDDVESILNVNIFGLWNLLDVCNEVGFELFVNTGSSSEYGYKHQAMRESDELSPNSYYGVAKVSQSILCQHCSKLYNRPIVSLRLFSVYGPYEDPGRLIPNIMQSILLNTKLNMTRMNTARDFIYIDDVVRALLMVDELSKLRGEIFNIGTGVQTSLSQLIAVAEEVAGRKLEVTWGAMADRPWDTDTWVADISKIRRYTGFLPNYDILDGLRASLSWFKANEVNYKKIYW